MPLCIIIDSMKGFAILSDYSNYMLAVKGRSPLTVKNYCFDISTFFRYIKEQRGLCESWMSFKDISLSDVDAEFLNSVSTEDILAYLVWLNRSKQLSGTTRARRIASLRSFFTYCEQKRHFIDHNPTNNIETPKIGDRNPKYLTLEESKHLLDVAYESPNEFNARNYCMLVLFLNCGMRLSELRGINLEMIKGNVLTVIGKGNKERTVYLNKSCLDALDEWYIARNKIKINEKDKNALFVSKLGNRISDDAIQYAIKRLLTSAGLDTTKYSVHKLRHTAATLMYKYGNVDIRSLQSILGHKSVSTTQIYTHVDEEQLRRAVASNPLAEYDPD